MDSYDDQLERIADRLQAVDAEAMSLGEVIAISRRSAVDTTRILIRRSIDPDLRRDLVSKTVEAYPAGEHGRTICHAIGLVKTLAERFSTSSIHPDSSMLDHEFQIAAMTPAYRNQLTISRRFDYLDQRVSEIRLIAEAVRRVWVQVPLEDFILKRYNIFRHAKDDSKPWLVHDGHGKYFLWESKVCQYVQYDKRRKHLIGEPTVSRM